MVGDSARFDQAKFTKPAYSSHTAFQAVAKGEQRAARQFCEYPAHPNASTPAERALSIVVLIRRVWRT